MDIIRLGRGIAHANRDRNQQDKSYKEERDKGAQFLQLLIQVPEYDSPAQDGRPCSGKHDAHIGPWTQADQESNHAADKRTRHPERKPYEKQQTRDAELHNPGLVSLSSVLSPGHCILQRLDHNQLAIREHEQGKEQQHHQRLNRCADNQDHGVIHPICESPCNAYRASADEMSAGHQEQLPEKVIRAQLRQAHGDNVEARQGNAEEEYLPLGRGDNLARRICRVGELRRDMRLGLAFCLVAVHQNVHCFALNSPRSTPAKSRHPICETKLSQ